MAQGKPEWQKKFICAISEADPEKLIKENRTRMKDFVISKAYLKA